MTAGAHGRSRLVRIGHLHLILQRIRVLERHRDGFEAGPGGECTRRERLWGYSVGKVEKPWELGRLCISGRDGH